MHRVWCHSCDFLTPALRDPAFDSTYYWLRQRLETLPRRMGGRRATGAQKCTCACVRSEDWTGKDVDVLRRSAEVKRRLFLCIGFWKLLGFNSTAFNFWKYVTENLLFVFFIIIIADLSMRNLIVSKIECSFWVWVVYVFTRKNEVEIFVLCSNMVIVFKK